MAHGLYWKYTIEYSAGLGGVRTAKAVTRVDGEETINGKQYYKVVTAYTGLPGEEANITYFRKSKEGMYKIAGKYKQRPEYLETPFPVEVGKSWTVQEPEGEILYRAEAIETAELFDKKYENCLKLTFEGDLRIGTKRVQYKGYSYLARGIGEVKSVREYKGMTRMILDYTLEEFKQ